MPKYDCATEQPLDAKGAERAAQAELNDRCIPFSKKFCPMLQHTFFFSSYCRPGSSDHSSAWSVGQTLGVWQDVLGSLLQVQEPLRSYQNFGLWVRWLGMMENCAPGCSARRESGQFAAAAGRVRQRCFNCGSYLHRCIYLGQAAL